MQGYLRCDKMTFYFDTLLSNPIMTQSMGLKIALLQNYIIRNAVTGTPSFTKPPQNCALECLFFVEHIYVQLT